MSNVCAPPLQGRRNLFTFKLVCRHAAPRDPTGGGAGRRACGGRGLSAKPDWKHARHARGAAHKRRRVHTLVLPRIYNRIPALIPRRASVSYRERRNTYANRTPPPSIQKNRDIYQTTIATRQASAQSTPQLLTLLSQHTGAYA